MLAKHILGYIPSFIIPAITSFGAVYIYTRLLTPEEYGHYALVINSMVLLVAVFFYWLQASMPRLLPQAMREGNADKLRVTAYVAFLSLSAILAAGVLAFTALVPRLGMQGMVVPVLLVTVSRALLNLNQTFHRSNLRFGRYNLIECGQAVIGITTGVALVYFGHMGARGAVSGLIFGMLCMALVDARSWLKAPFREFSPVLLKEIAHFGLPLILGFGFSVVISTSDRFLIEYFHGADQVGIYAAGYTLTDRIIGIVFMMVAIPSLPLTVHRLEQEGIEGARDQTYKNGVAALALALPACAGLILTNHQLANAFIGPAFREGAQKVMPLIAISGLLNGLSTHYFDHAFHLGKKTKLFIFTLGPAALLNLTLNLLLIPREGYVGAAWSTLISYALLVMLSLSVGRRSFRIKFPVRPSLQIAASVAMMVVALTVFTFPLGFSGLLAMMALGGTTYAFGICLFNVMGVRDWLIKRFMKRVRHG